MKLDIVVTWPKSKPLTAYLAELRRAEYEGLVINYRVARLPRWSPRNVDLWGRVRPVCAGRPARCYMVYDGAVRGWCEILYACERDDGEVEGWPAGKYIVRDPKWHHLETPIPMSGFQGWRWFDGGPPTEA